MFLPRLSSGMKGHFPTRGPIVTVSKCFMWAKRMSKKSNVIILVCLFLTTSVEGRLWKVLLDHSRILGTGSSVIKGGDVIWQSGALSPYLRSPQRAVARVSKGPGLPGTVLVCPGLSWF